MGEAVRTMASPAATWVIVVTASCLALFMASAAIMANRFQIREHRRMRKLGIWPAPAAALDTDIDEGLANPWPRLSEALFEAARAPSPTAMGAAAWTEAGYTAAGHDFPAQIPAQRQEPAEHPAALYAGAPEAEGPTEPIPAAETTRPDLLAQEAPRRHAVPTQRTGESDRAERSLAGPAPQDDDEGEQ